MTNTTYYNLNIVEGTDIVNPLTVDNPNYEKIDETMHNNAVSGVTLATEIANATVHAITRENSECAVIRFIATSEWKAGDTVTVDGVPVTALLPSGEVLPDGAYVINSNVLCILTGTNMTVFAERKKTDTAKDIKYNDTNVGAELDKVNINLGAIGQIYSTPLIGNCSPGTTTNVGSLTLPEGTYIINADFGDVGSTNLNHVNVYLMNGDAVIGCNRWQSSITRMYKFDVPTTISATINLDSEASQISLNGDRNYFIMQAVSLTK